jgi:hypothetical protein
MLVANICRASFCHKMLQISFWDALLILRHTGMRFEDLAHLKAPDGHGRKGCLSQDSDGYWWICIDDTNTKMGREHRIPTREVDGVIDAIRRQQEGSNICQTTLTHITCFGPRRESSRVGRSSSPSKSWRPISSTKSNHTW